MGSFNKIKILIEISFQTEISLFRQTIEMI